MHLRGWIVSAKKHGWWSIPLIIFALTSGSYWVRKVEAESGQHKIGITQLQTVIPEINKQMVTTNERLEKIDERTMQMNQRLSNIEGRLRR